MINFYHPQCFTVVSQSFCSQWGRGSAQRPPPPVSRRWGGEGRPPFDADPLGRTPSRPPFADTPRQIWGLGRPLDADPPRQIPLDAEPPGIRKQAGFTHPTGMHTCMKLQV